MNRRSAIGSVVAWFAGLFAASKAIAGVVTDEWTRTGGGSPCDMRARFEIPGYVTIDAATVLVVGRTMVVFGDIRCQFSDWAKKRLSEQSRIDVHLGELTPWSAVLQEACVSGTHAGATAAFVLTDCPIIDVHGAPADWWALRYLEDFRKVGGRWSPGLIADLDRLGFYKGKQ